MKRICLLATLLLFGCYEKQPKNKRVSNNIIDQKIYHKHDDAENEVRTIVSYYSDDNLYNININILYKFKFNDSNYEKDLTNEFMHQASLVCGDESKIDNTKILYIALQQSGFSLGGDVICK